MKEADSTCITPEAGPDGAQRIFLVVVDDSTEMQVALRFACRRARSTRGRVALLRVLEPIDFNQWRTVAELMREEQREEAERLLQRLAESVNHCAGHVPVLYVREGSMRDELLNLIDEEPSISILVLAAGTGPEGPGPLVSSLAGKMSGKLRIPITVVPGNLTPEQIEALA